MQKGWVFFTHAQALILLLLLLLTQSAVVFFFRLRPRRSVRTAMAHEIMQAPRTSNLATLQRIAS